MSAGRHQRDVGHWTAEQMRAGVEHANALAEQLERIAGQRSADRATCAVRDAELRVAEAAAAQHALDAAREHARLVEVLESLPGACRSNRCSECSRDIGDETHMIEKGTGLSVCNDCGYRREAAERLMRRANERRRAADAAQRLQEVRREEVRARQQLLYTAQGVRYERRHLRLARGLLVVCLCVVITALIANPIMLVAAAIVIYMMVNMVRGMRGDIARIVGPPNAPRSEHYRPRAGLPSRRKVARAVREHAEAEAAHEQAMHEVLTAEAAVAPHVAWPEIFPAPGERTDG